MRMRFPGNSCIEAKTIEIDPSLVIGENVQITSNTFVKIGKYSNLGNNLNITANSVSIGEHFFHMNGLVAGGGGSQFPYSDLTIGDRCVMHNAYINLCRAVTLGNDVGLSPDVQIITHGFWESPLEGYPFKYGPVVLEDGVIIGQRCMILPGVIIRNHIIVGGQSTVTRNLEELGGIYGGSPARFKKYIHKPSRSEQKAIVEALMLEYLALVDHYKILDIDLKVDFPVIHINGVALNVLDKTCVGQETKASDDFRDFLRRYGIKIYTTRPFGDMTK